MGGYMTLAQLAPCFQESCKLDCASYKSASHCKSASQSWLVAHLRVIGRCAHFNVKLLHFYSDLFWNDLELVKIPRLNIIFLLAVLVK